MYVGIDNVNPNFLSKSIYKHKIYTNNAYRFWKILGTVNLIIKFSFSTKLINSEKLSAWVWKFSRKVRNKLFCLHLYIYHINTPIWLRSENKIYITSVYKKEKYTHLKMFAPSFVFAGINGDKLNQVAIWEREKKSEKGRNRRERRRGKKIGRGQNSPSSPLLVRRWVIAGRLANATTPPPLFPIYFCRTKCLC